MTMPQKPQIYVLFLFLSGLISCAKMSDENALKQRINDLVQVIEAHDATEINGFLATDFMAGNNLNKDGFNLFVRYHLQRNKNISVVKANERININGAMADVTADVFITGASGWLPQHGQKYYIESRWKKEKDTWLIQRLRWQPE